MLINLKKENILHIFFISGLLFATNIQAQNSVNTNMEISAKIISGCIIYGSDMNFGDVTFSQTKSKTVDSNLHIGCSKGTTVTVGAKSKNNPDGYTGQWMTQNGLMVKQSREMKDPSVGIQYAMRTNNLVDTSDYTITQRPKYNWLNSYVSTNNHYMKIKFLSSNINKLPIFAKILDEGEEFNNNNFSKLIAGNYYDTLTYELSF